MERRKKVAVSALKKKKRLVITLEQKLALINRHSRGETNAKISRDTGLNESTIRQILKHTDEIRAKGKALASGLGLQTFVRNRSFLMIEMENRLSQWIEDSNKNDLNVNKDAIRTKARCIFTELKENEAYAGTKETFSASLGWFARFKNRFNLSAVKIMGEAGSADQEAASNYTYMKNVVEEDLFVQGENLPSDKHNEDSNEDVSDDITTFSSFPSRLPEEEEEEEPSTLEDSKMGLMSRLGIVGDEEDRPNNSDYFVPPTNVKLENEISSTIPGTIDHSPFDNAPRGNSTSEYNVFGNSVAAQLNNMPLRHAIQLQLDIQQLIAERRLRLIEEGAMNDYI